MTDIIRVSPSGPELVYPATQSGKVLGINAAGQVRPQLSGGRGIPAPSTSHIIFVSEVFGSDVTGDGTQAFPYQTIAHAQSTTTPSAADVWDIVLFPGSYTANVQLLAFTRLVGFDPTMGFTCPAILNGTITLGASFAAATAVASVTNVQVTGAMTLDFIGASSADGTVAITDCLLSANVTVDALGLNFVTFTKCILEGAFEQDGGNVIWKDVSNRFSTTMTINGRSGTSTLFTAFAGGWGGTLHASQAGVTDQTVAIDLQGFSVAGAVRITASGALCPTITAPLGATLPNPLLDGSAAAAMSSNMSIAAVLTVPSGTVLAGLSTANDFVVPLTAGTLGADSIDLFDCNLTLLSGWSSLLKTNGGQVTLSVHDNAGTNEVHLLILISGPGLTTATDLKANFSAIKR